MKACNVRIYKATAESEKVHSRFTVRINAAAITTTTSVAKVVTVSVVTVVRIVAELGQEFIHVVWIFTIYAVVEVKLRDGHLCCLKSHSPPGNPLSSLDLVH